MAAVPRRLDCTGLASCTPRCRCAPGRRLVGRRHGRVREPASSDCWSGDPAGPSRDTALAMAAAPFRPAPAVAASPADHRGGLADRRRDPGGAVGADLRRWPAGPGRRPQRRRRCGVQMVGRVAGTWAAGGDADTGRTRLLSGHYRAAVGAAAGPAGAAPPAATAGRPGGLDPARALNPVPAGPTGATTAAVRGPVPRRLVRLGPALRAAGSAGGGPGRNPLQPGHRGPLAPDR
jgi:hypothetical protein